MPIYELGYRHWEGALRSKLLRWWPITRMGIAQAWRSKILRRLIFFAWTPLFYFVPIFLGIGFATEEGSNLAMWLDAVGDLLGDDIAAVLLQNMAGARPAAWSFAFYIFFSLTQSILTMLVVAIVGPPLISQDFRSKASLVYFSKPLTRFEYILGKAGVLLFYILLVTSFPAFALYGVSIGFAPSLTAMLDTAMVLVRIFSASLVLAVPITLLVLYLSSLVMDGRYASFVWMVICLMGFGVFKLLYWVGMEDSEFIFLASLRDVIAVVTQSIFDVSGQLAGLENTEELQEVIKRLEDPYSPLLGMAYLGLISLISVVGLFRRIGKQMQI